MFYDHYYYSKIQQKYFKHNYYFLLKNKKIIKNPQICVTYKIMKNNLHNLNIPSLIPSNYK